MHCEINGRAQRNRRASGLRMLNWYRTVSRTQGCWAQAHSERSALVELLAEVGVRREARPLGGGGVHRSLAVKRVLQQGPEGSGLVRASERRDRCIGHVRWNNRVHQSLPTRACVRARVGAWAHAWVRARVRIYVPNAASDTAASVSHENPNRFPHSRTPVSAALPCVCSPQQAPGKDAPCTAGGSAWRCLHPRSTARARRCSAPPLAPGARTYRTPAAHAPLASRLQASRTRNGTAHPSQHAWPPASISSTRPQTAQFCILTGTVIAADTGMRIRTCMHEAHNG
jgi:hypothetical protein